MSNNIFDSYLKNGCLPSIGGDDSIYKKLNDAAQTVSNQLKEEPTKICSYSLVAIDNDIKEDEPILEDIENSIKEHWQMLRSQFPQMPILLYRAVILRALELLVENNPDENFATIIYLSIVDVYPYFSIAHKEQLILKEFIQRLGDIVETKAIAEWTIDKSDIVTKIPTLNLKLSNSTKINKAKVDEETLKEQLINASDPYIQVGGARRSNHQWTTAHFNQWSTRFAPLAAKGITDVVNKALSEQYKETSPIASEIQTELNKILTKLRKNLQGSMEEAIQSSVAVERRSQLLWWKDTLYSPQLHKSYRKLSKFECVVAMAVDLYYLLPAIFPVSVDYILREVFFEVQGFENNEIAFIDFLSHVDDLENSPFLKKYFKQNESIEGRTNLVSFMEKIMYSKVDIKKELTTSIGILPDKKISYEDISVWILHCLAVDHLTQD